MARKLSVTIIVFFLVILTCLNSCAENRSGDSIPESRKKIRSATVAGSFYPGDRELLKKEVIDLLANAGKRESSGTILAATAPHAGYEYSGGIAACTFKNISDVDFDTIVIIGHDSSRDAVAYTCPVDYFETPLGRVQVDIEMVDKLQKYNKGIRPNISIHSNDHTVEVQLPFIQSIKKEFKIVPLLFGYPSPENCRILADAIKSASAGKKIFVLASSDMSHYPTWEGADKMDHMTLDMIKTMDINRFFNHVYKQMRDPQIQGLITPMCASGGVGTAMLLAKEAGADTVEVLKYASSGDIPGGDKSRVVGYSSVLFIKNKLP